MDVQSRFQPIVLPDGTRLRVRPIRPDDAPRLQALAKRCSPRTIYLRANVMRPLELTDAEAAFLAHVDYRSTMALVALTGVERHGVGPHGEIVGVARYACSKADPGQAEAAIVVEDAYQRGGIGGELLARLVPYARGQGVSTLVGNVLCENGPVLALLAGTGLAAEYYDAGCGEYQVIVPLPRWAGIASLPALTAARIESTLRWPRHLAGQLAVLMRGL